MYCWGANSHGQLGLGFCSEMCAKPQQVECLPFELHTVRTVSGGGGHTLVSTNNGDLFGCGWNNRGQLGLGHTEDVHRFALVGSYNFDNVTCGWDVSGALTVDGDVYLWGSNVWQQVADKSLKYVSRPAKFELPGQMKAKTIHFGLRHTCILSDNGTIFLFGRAKWLAKDNFQSILHGGIEMYYLMYPEGIVDVVSGENHLVIKLEQNIIMCIGDNKFGQSPSGLDLNPNKLEVVQLKSGWAHSGYSTSNGSVYLWGRNNHGQLGVPLAERPNEVILLKLNGRVMKFCLGSQHGIALATDGVYTWGWNEHGNCGTGGDENVLIPTRVDGIGKIDEIAAGAGFCIVLRKM
ncbi:secretion-regulating guanine nucleotide exchange factor [Toxorhynchites rutilus septentrionalis]|uniref:secretion-regulating guanine nucleotide exchange factor n=1 Tax=Toxorhynchites rutilus septentrionalis TaxID=329112 RepID=UPI002478E712|nr:secretion-regulating guanine nucleotide exchange factor [Toxorhynchites rutilus septentrionalis]